MYRFPVSVPWPPHQFPLHESLLACPETAAYVAATAAARIRPHSTCLLTHFQFTSLLRHGAVQQTRRFFFPNVAQINIQMNFRNKLQSNIYECGFINICSKEHCSLMQM